MKDRRINEIPEPLIPVLADIRIVNDIGESKWYEVVYHDGVQWRPFFGSDTFSEGENVVNWQYAHECFNLEESLENNNVRD